MSRSDTPFGLPGDPVARKKATGGVKHTTGQRASEGWGEWDYGQPGHSFKLKASSRRQDSGEPFWQWICECGAKGHDRYTTEAGAISKGDRHSIDARQGKSSPPAHVEVPAEEWSAELREGADRLFDRRQGKEVSEEPPARIGDSAADNPGRPQLETPEERLARQRIADNHEKRREKRRSKRRRRRR